MYPDHLNQIMLKPFTQIRHPGQRKATSEHKRPDFGRSSVKRWRSGWLTSASDYICYCHFVR